jgi:osmotically-inducible protein OsmY
MQVHRRITLGTLSLLVACWLPIFSGHSVSAEPVMTDQSITDKIDDELLFDHGVVSTKIDVSTSNGVVTLSGDVSNILAKERATRVAETVKGVRAVVDQINVRPAVTRSDVQIRRDVESALLLDPATEAYEITATVNGGEVKLTGTVDSYQERELTNKVAKGVRGVVAVDDQIVVNYKADRPDGEIKKEIEQALNWNAYVDDQMVDVAVNDGRVSMSGTVGSAAEKRMAGYDGWVAGVSSVDTSKLSVSDWARDKKLRGDKYIVKTDAELEKAVNDSMLYDPRVMSFNVAVSAANSIITLRGDVDNLKAKRAAEQDARNTVGVVTVINRLKVRDSGAMVDTQVAESIRDAFLRDPYVERFEITASVIGGTAHLYGTVDSYFERNRADEIASRVPGVLDVENHLDVDYDTPYIFDPYVDDTYVDDDHLVEYEPRTPLASDTELKKSIQSELWWSPFVDADQVTVSVNDGIATLSGTVDTWGERQAATENAYQGGATLVDNDLAINF